MKLTPKEITEKKAWNEFLNKTESGHLFQSFDWGVFKETQGWKVRRIGLTDSAENMKAALSILEKEILLTSFKIWYLPRGPVLDFQDKELVGETADFLIGFAKKNNVMAIKISPDAVLEENTKWISELLKDKGFRETIDYQLHKRTVRINLQKDLEKILSDFKKNTRWEISKAEKDGVTIKKGKDENDLKIFYRLYSESMKREKLPYGYFKELWKTFKEDVLILNAFYREEPLSAVFVPFFNKKCWYLFGGSTKKQSTHYASQLLQREIIKQAKERGAAVYDLQGIPCGEPKTPHDKGVLQFKEGFGGERTELIGEFDYAFFPMLYPMLRRLNQARVMIRGMMGMA